MKFLFVSVLLLACQIEDSTTKMDASPSAANRNTNGSSGNQQQTPFTEVEDTDQLSVAYRKILDKYAQDPADLLKLLDQNQDEAFAPVEDLLVEHEAHLMNELNNMKGVSENEDGRWEIEYPNNEEGHARKERFHKLIKQLDTVRKDHKKLANLVKNDLRERLAESKRLNRELKEQLKQLKQDLREAKQKARELRRRQNELIMNLAESIRGWSKSFGEAVDNYKAGLEEIGCTIDNCTINEKNTEQATQANERLAKLQEFLNAVTSAKVTNGLQGIEVKGLAVLNFAMGLGETSSTIKLTSEQLSSDSQVTLFIGDNNLSVNLPADNVYFQLNPDDRTVVAKDKSNNILATGTLSLTDPANSRVGLKIRNTRIRELKITDS